MQQLISIHAPTRGATNLMLTSQENILLLQSTLPREERHNIVGNMTMPVQISIHAPTRGATLMFYKLTGLTLFQSTLPREERLDVEVLASAFNIFQSTLPREERHASNGYQRVCGNFNPRSHERSDTNFLNQYLTTPISIHAPTRGATSAYI